MDLLRNNQGCGECLNLYKKNKSSIYGRLWKKKEGAGAEFARFSPVGEKYVYVLGQAKLVGKKTRI